MNNQHRQYGGEHNALFALVRNHTTATINDVLDGGDLPADASQDPTENELRSAAAAQIEEEIAPRMAEVEKELADIKSFAVPFDEPANIASETKRELADRENHHDRELEHVDREIAQAHSELRIESRISGATVSLNPPTRQGFLALAIVAFIAEFTINAFYLVNAGVHGGLKTTWGIAAVFAALNLALGMLLGNTVSPNGGAGRGAWKRGTRTALIGSAAVTSNTVLMWMQAFARNHDEAFHNLLTGNFGKLAPQMTTEFLITGIGSAIVGLCIVAWVAAKWSRVPPYGLSKLIKTLRDLRRQRASKIEAFHASVVDDAAKGKQRLEELRDTTSDSVLKISHAIIDIKQKVEEAADRQAAIRRDYEGAANIYRMTVRGALLGHVMPAYLTEAANFADVAKSVPNLTAVERHSDVLWEQTTQLATAIGAARDAIEISLQELLRASDAPAPLHGTNDTAPGNAGAEKAFHSSTVPPTMQPAE